MPVQSLNSFARLNNGVDIPRLGLGVYKIEDGESCYAAVKEAIHTGYRHFDTATIYNNEVSVGKAVRECGLPRAELFVTTKLWNIDQGYGEAIKAFNLSLKRLGLEYIDLYLVHWPVSGKRKESWKALETVYSEGKCRAIGVSNYMRSHLDELTGFCKVVPAINQIELHPFNYLYRKELVDFCFSGKIQVEAYSPLVKGTRLKHPILEEIARQYGKTAAQVLIRWALQMNWVVIPKTQTPARIRENADVFNFEISKEDITRITALNDNYLCSWDPTQIP
jgi:methylglyoxal/glyoxal reductase